MMKISSSFALVLVLVTGCASRISGPDASPYAPAEELTAGPREGMVAYNPHGAKDLVDMRRKDALKKMYEACGNSNQYKIESETLQKHDEKDSSLANLGAYEVIVIKFRCL